MRLVIITEGTPKSTTRVVGTDAAQALSSDITDPGGVRANQALITIEANSARVSFVTTPTGGDTGIGHSMGVGDTITLSSWANIKAFRFMNRTPGFNAIIQVTVGI